MAIHVTVRVEAIDQAIVCRSISVTGHQQQTVGKLGLLCASVSFLFRTVANSLANTLGIDIELIHPQRGMLEIDIRSYTLETVPILSTIYNLVLQGVHDLKSEYPHELTLEIVQYNA